ncbi:MAG: class I SAM-dependent methyltransferase [Thermoprotei archaeon]|jgi:predicted methyltransferase
MRIYLFKPKYYPLITSYTAKYLLESKNRRTNVSLDLGLTNTEVIIDNDHVYFPNFQTLSKNDLKKIINRTTEIYTITNNELVKIEWFENNMYLKLRNISHNTAPTLEINGIHMHRIKDTTPWKDSKSKVMSVLPLKNKTVLDVCTGLGYTAIHALNFGASKVITIEKNYSVLKIAEYNPWSWKLANKKITIILDDAKNAVNYLRDEYFDRIIHDPPRMKLAGELYSKEFYKELYRVLKPGGIIFHYTGAPGEKRGINLIKGVSERLKSIGFSIKKLYKIQGVLGVKK